MPGAATMPKPETKSMLEAEAKREGMLNQPPVTCSYVATLLSVLLRLVKYLVTKKEIEQEDPHDPQIHS